MRIVRSIGGRFGLVLPLVVAGAMSAGCAGTMKAYDGPELPDAEIAIVEIQLDSTLRAEKEGGGTTDKRALRVFTGPFALGDYIVHTVKVDDKVIADDPVWSGLPRRIGVLPGPRSLTFGYCRAPGGGLLGLAFSSMEHLGEKTFQVNLEAAHRYQVKWIDFGDSKQGEANLNEGRYALRLVDTSAPGVALTE